MLEYRTESVASADGTTIGYRTIGQGPGIVLVQGAMGTALNTTTLRAPSPAPSRSICRTAFGAA